MEKEKPQSFANHTRLVPAFHMFVLPVLMLNVGHTLYEVFRVHVSFGSILDVLVSIALLLAALFGRVFAVSVQDRLIQLEMRLRLAELLPMDLKEKIGDFTLGQLISLRFASDAELPDLARRVLDERLTDRAAIKKLIKNWRPDYLRA